MRDNTYNISRTAKSALFYAIPRIGTCDYSLNFPISITIRPTSACNRKCNFCLCESRNANYGGIHVDYHCLENCFEDFQHMDIKGITLAGGGEPTIIPPQKLHGLFCGPYKVFIHTNGVLIDRYFDVLLPNTLYVSFSVIAHDPLLYSVISGSSSQQFNTIINNIKKICKIYAPSMTRQAKILISRDNVLYLERMANLYQNLGLDKIRYSIVKNYESNQNNEIDERSKSQVFHYLTTQNISEYVAKNIVWGSELHAITPTKCWICELGMYGTLEPDGKVFCCSQWSNDDSVCIGNIHESSYLNIWKSQRHYEVLKELNNRCANGRCNPITCRHYSSNVAIELLLTGILPYKRNDTDSFPFI